jgi:polar amino acid transport system substrate-binding protein
MRKQYILILFMVNLLMLIAGCAGAGTAGSQQVVQPPPLRVGITPDSPPIIFKQQTEIVGVEADLARELGKALGRPVQFVEIPWERQIDYLIQGQTDIIMSGMSVTDARLARIRFAKPYMKSGLTAMMRTEDAGKYQTPRSVLQSTGLTGVQKDTTGEAFVRERMPNATLRILRKPGSAVYSLNNREIDVFIHDLPAVVWMVSENEGEVTALRSLLTEEYLAWGVRTSDPALLARIDTLLAGWRKDGTLNRILNYWMPYLRRLGML